MHKFAEFLKTLPEWQSIVGAIAFFVVLAFGVIRPLMYRWALDRLAETVRVLHPGKNIVVTTFPILLTGDDEAIVGSKPTMWPLAAWRWLIARAQRWEIRRQRWHRK